MMKLVLWDIDHTLIATRGVGRELFGECFEHVTGQPMKEQALIDGMTEPVIFRETARLHGINTDRAQFEAFAACSARRHQARAHDLRERGHALPGAAAALAAVAGMDGVTQSVVTGNIRPVAEIKLAVFGLDTHIQFDCGGYGEDHDDRAELVRTAIMRTAQAWGAPVSPADVLLIGDTPADIAAGQETDVQVLAVATGRTNLTDLQNAAPTHAIASLQDLTHLRALLT
ncbi:haloacid dehalogenase-like hydrolase [Streptomyces sp. NPDC050273]|uniref:HAD family hydrolase n=1 Tax=Streptomyces sp. NPDC050273 TaxID=3154933 RepID=UPI00344513FB